MLFILTSLFMAICYFQPPNGWECVQPDEPSDVIGFLGKAKALVPPSLNFTTEETNLTLKEYVKAVKDLHESDLHLTWRDLGEFSFRAGKGRLGELTNPTPYGDIKILQAIYLKDGCAYILTGAAIKEEFAEHRAAILAAFRSLNLLPDLFSPISNLQKRDELQKQFDQFCALESELERREEWASLQKSLPNEFGELGSYWLHLALQEGRRRIFSTEISPPVE